MMPFKRGVNPLSSEEEKMLGEWWSEEYTTKKEIKQKPIWSWKEKYEILKDALLLCNNDHCAYCDCHPLKDDRAFEIDHFKPKVKYFLEAFTYSNLFPSCRECNKTKRNKYDASLIKPDEIGYKFGDFFRYDSFTGKILVKESRPIENQKRAEITLKTFDFNIGNKHTNRMKAVKKDTKANTLFEERPYRYAYKNQENSVK